MQKLIVDLKQNTYPIYVGHHILQESDLWGSHVGGKQVLIISQRMIADYYVDKVQTALFDKQCDLFLLPNGEHHKNLQQWSKLMNHLIEQAYHRDATIIALGGGMVSDISGFVAACYLRGIGFINAPTTLLAQVDAAIGGKTAVNHAKGKNLIGAFHHPKAVIIDVATLSSLPQREFIAGLAEMIKAALLGDADFFNELVTHHEKIIQRDSQTLMRIIYKACLIKRDIVMQDERENGLRALLNLGHTFGHAIENILGYEKLLHGEAVAIGLAIASRMSQFLGHITQSDVDSIVGLLNKVGLPTEIPSEITHQGLLAAMQRDKKINQQKIRLVLLHGIGKAYIEDAINPQDLAIFLDQLEKSYH